MLELLQLLDETVPAARRLLWAVPAQQQQRTRPRRARRPAVWQAVLSSRHVCGELLTTAGASRRSGVEARPKRLAASRKAVRMPKAEMSAVHVIVATRLPACCADCAAPRTVACSPTDVHSSAKRLEHVYMSAKLHPCPDSNGRTHHASVTATHPVNRKHAASWHVRSACRSPKWRTSGPATWKSGTCRQGTGESAQHGVLSKNGLAVRGTLPGAVCMSLQRAVQICTGRSGGAAPRAAPAPSA